MDLPSPVISKFLPTELVSGMLECDLRAENYTVNCLLTYSALGYYYRKNLCAADPLDTDSNEGRIAFWVSRFIGYDAVDHYSGLCLESKTGVCYRLPMSSSAIKAQVDVGEQCCSKALFPFSSNKSKDSSFIVQVASSFGRVGARLRGLWKSGDADCLMSVRGALMNNLIIHNQASHREECHWLAVFALEAFCLEVHDSEYRPLPDAAKADARNVKTRKMFWCASFFYNMLRHGWEKEMEVDGWVETFLDGYLSISSGLERAQYSKLVMDAESRLDSKEEALINVRRFVSDSELEEHELLTDLEQKLIWLTGFKAEKYNITPQEHDQFRDCVHQVNMSVVILGNMTIPLILPQADLAEDREMQASDNGAQVDRNRRKKKSRNQRRKVNRDKQTSELICILEDVCAQVAMRAAIEATEQETRWLGERYSMNLRAADFRIHRIIEARKERERIAVAQWERTAREFMRQTAAEVQTQIAQRARRNVLVQMRARTLPSAFAVELLGGIFPFMENMLVPAVECFVCMQPIDFRAPGVGYLVCCDGGSFACHDCINAHDASNRHPLRVERQIVMLATSLRRNLGLDA
jgi:hypothetical protein